MKNKLFAFLSIFSLVFTLAFPTIVTASGPLQSQLPTTSYETLPNSLLITTPNVDLSKIRDTRPLFEGQKKLLMAKGYSKEQIDLMNIEDYNAITKTWKLAPTTIEAAKRLYPELEKVDMTNWTFGEFARYYTKVDDATYAPTADEAKKLSERKITLADARYLLKEFYSYEKILAQPDVSLKDILEKRNQFNLNFANKVSQIGVSEVTLSATPPSDYIDNYVQAYMPGYGQDWFHVDSESWDPDIATWQADKAATAFRAIYNVSTSVTPYFTNMWGTYSVSQDGTHEGIDMAYGTYPTVYSIANGSVLKYNTSIGQLAIYDSYVTNRTVFYNHLNSIKINGTTYNGTVTNPYPAISVSKYSSIGTQGSKGNATGLHVHLEVQNGSTTNQSVEYKNHNLDSSNPYGFIFSNLY